MTEDPSPSPVIEKKPHSQQKLGIKNNTQGTDFEKTDVLDEGVWFVYDGDCQLCTQAAIALRIKEKHGPLKLLNARDNFEHQLLQKIQTKQLDLDEGMVIYHQGHFYHGATALQFMARFGAAKGWFNWFNKTIFWSKSLAKLLYPWIRGVRNFLLMRKGVSRIDNLHKSQQPLFQAIFGKQWVNLPPALKRHYQPQAYGDEAITFKGKMDIQCQGPMKWLAPALWLLRGIPPKTEKQIPVKVSFISQTNEPALQFDRQFNFKNKKPYRFQSKLYPQNDGNVAEVMKYGITWKMKLYWDQDRIKMEHQGYALKWFGHLIPVPMAWLFGKAYAEEVAVDEHSFDMSVKITHSLWGEIYSYRGRFESENSTTMD